MRALLTQLLIELRLTLRRGESLLVTLAIPIGVLVLFARIPLSDGSNRLDNLAPGVLAVAVIATAMVSLGIATGYERHYLVLKRLGATPLGRGRLIAAKACAVVAVEIVQLALIGGVAIALGWRPQVRPALLLALLLGTAAFAGLGLLMAGALRADINLALSNALFVFLALTSGVLMASDRFPDLLATVTRLLPAEPLVVLFEAATSAASIPARPVLVLVAWAIAAPAAAAATFSWD